MNMLSLSKKLLTHPKRVNWVNVLSFSSIPKYSDGWGGMELGNKKTIKSGGVGREGIPFLGNALDRLLFNQHWDGW